MGIPLVIIAGPMSLFLVVVVITMTIQWITAELSLTNQRIVIKPGWMSTSVREMSLSKVEAIRVEQGVFGKLFRCGSLVVSGSGGTRRKCADVMNPFEFYQRVQEQVAITEKTA